MIKRNINIKKKYKETYKFNIKYRSHDINHKEKNNTSVLELTQDLIELF